MIEVAAHTVIVAAIMYPIWGGVMYADPWQWPLKSSNEDDK